MPFQHVDRRSVSILQVVARTVVVSCNGFDGERIQVIRNVQNRIGILDFIVRWGIEIPVIEVVPVGVVPSNEIDAAWQRSDGFYMVLTVFGFSVTDLQQRVEVVGVIPKCRPHGVLVNLANIFIVEDIFRKAISLPGDASDSQLEVLADLQGSGGFSVRKIKPPVGGSHAPIHLVAGFLGVVGECASCGVLAEKGPLRPSQDLNPVHVEQGKDLGRIGPHDDPIPIDTHRADGGRVEIVVAYAANRDVESAGDGLEVQIGYTITDGYAVGKILFPYILRCQCGHRDRYRLKGLIATLSGYNHLFENLFRRTCRRGHDQQQQGAKPRASRRSPPDQSTGSRQLRYGMFHSQPHICAPAPLLRWATAGYRASACYNLLSLFFMFQRALRDVQQ